MSGPALAPRMLRARITEPEHHALTVIAAQTKTPVADLVAAALRATYPLTPEGANRAWTVNTSISARTAIPSSTL